MCRTPTLAPGPRNVKKKGFCGSLACTIKGLLALAAEDMLERHEADHLNELLGGAALTHHDQEAAEGE